MHKKNTKNSQAGDSLDRELYNLFEESAVPRKEFVKNLKTQVVSQAHMTSPQSNFISLLFMKLSKPTVRMAAVAAVLVLGAGAAGYNYLYPREFAGQNEILAKIAQANEGVKRDASTATAAMGEADQKISALYIRPAEDRDYNYRKYTNIYEIGRAASKCTPMVPYQASVAKDELYEYFSTKDEAFPKYMKNVAYTAENDIYDYNLTVDSDRWQYRGGSYAMHLKNVQQIMPLAATAEPIPENVKSTDPGISPEEAPEPTETKQDPNEMIKNYFGENARIVGTDLFNGKKVYKAQWTFDASCTDLSTNPDSRVSSSSAELDQQITVVALADADKFGILSESYYFGSASNRNLLYTHTMSEEKRSVADFSAVQNEFTFSFNVETKTVDSEAYQYDKEYKKAVLDYLNKNSSDVAYLSSKAKLQSVSSPYVTVVPDQDAHLIDRAFYSTKAYGQELYDENKDMFKPYQEAGKTYPTAQLSYEGSGVMSWISLAVMPSSFTGVNAVELLGADKATIKSIGSTTVQVNGNAVTAEVYQVEQEVNRSFEGSGSDSVEMDTLPSKIDPDQQFKDIYVVFAADGVTGVVQSSVKEKVTLSEIGKALVVSTMKTSDVSKMDKTLVVPLQSGGRDLIAL